MQAALVVLAVSQPSATAHYLAVQTALVVKAVPGKAEYIWDTAMAHPGRARSADYINGIALLERIVTVNRPTGTKTEYKAQTFAGKRDVEYLCIVSWRSAQQMSGATVPHYSTSGKY